MGRGGGRRGPHHGRARDEGSAERSHFRGRGGAGGGGRIFGAGDLRLMLLALIREKPYHGYELIKAIEGKFGGGYSPSPGSVYPSLTLLEELGQLRSSVSDGVRKLFEITPDGVAFLNENKATLDGVLARIGLMARAISGRAVPESIHQAMHTLRTALMYRGGNWSDAQTRRIAKIIEEAVSAIGEA